MLNISFNDWPISTWRRQTLSEDTVGWIAMGINVMAACTYSAFAKTLSEVLAPQSLLLLSETLTAFFILFSFGVFPTVRGLFRLSRKQLLPMLLVGVFSGCIGPLLWFTGVHYTSAVNATLFGNSEMVFMILLAVFFLHEKFTKAHVLSISTISCGILLIALQGFTQQIALREGDLLIILAGFGFAAGSVLFRKYLHRIDPHLMLLVRSLVGIGSFFLISPFVHVPLIEDVTSFPLKTLPVLLGFALISRFLNAFSFYITLDRLPVFTVSLCTNLTVVCAIIFSVWFLNESLEWYHFVGGALIVLGALLLEILGVHPTEKHHRTHLHHKMHRG